MQARQSGFTLIELIMVIVILGALAVIAIPRYIDLQSEAQQAATQGVAGALSAAGAINYAAAVAGSGDASAVANCDVAGGLLAEGQLPTGYTITAAPVAPGETVNCTLTGPGGDTATFVAYGVAP